MEKNEWLKWRHMGLGGSDAPVIMGVSPWKTPYKLWEDRIAPEPKPQEPNFITDRGDRYEPRIRSLWCLHSGTEYEVALLESDTVPFMRVSLDGISPDRTSIIEIKTAGKADHELAKAGKVPEKYVAQVQHELFVSGAPICYYLSYNDELWDEKNVRMECLAVVEVLPDLEYISKMIIEQKKFWAHVETRTPPPLSDADYKRLTGMSKIAAKYRRIMKRIEVLKTEADEQKDRLLQQAEESGHPRVKISGFKFSKVHRIGNVNYAKIPELKGVDLDKFRNPGSQYWKMTEDKERQE